MGCIMRVDPNSERDRPSSQKFSRYIRSLSERPLAASRSDFAPGFDHFHHLATWKQARRLSHLTFKRRQVFALGFG